MLSVLWSQDLIIEEEVLLDASEPEEGDETEE